MGRPPRLHYDGAFYHFIARGNNRQPIFLGAKDRRLFEGYLTEGVERFGYRCHAYCWMTNHVHLAIEVSDVPLSHIAHNLLFRYARAFHREHGRIGHLFERRYRAAVVETDNDLLSLVRYIHLNPIRAGIVENPETYPWSSYSAYLSPGRRSPAWLTRSFVLSLLASSPALGRGVFRAFHQEQNEGEGDWAVKAESRPTRPRRPGGGFQDGPSTSRRRAVEPGPIPTRVTLDQILRAVCSACSIEPSLLCADVQKRTVVRARSLASLLVSRNPNVTLEELGAVVGRDSSTLSRAANKTARRLAHDSELQTLVEQIILTLERI